LQRSPVAAQQTPRIHSIIASNSMPWQFLDGWMSGGSLMIRRSPSTTRVSLSKACMLYECGPFARFASARLRAARSSSPGAGAQGIESKRGIPHREILHRANSRMASRYAPSRAAGRPCAPSPRSRCRAAIESWRPVASHPIPTGPGTSRRSR